MQTLIVTGGAGFIGSNFVRYMLGKYPNYRIIVLDALTYAGNKANLDDVWKNPNFTFIEGDIRDAKIVDNLTQNADAVVNFAAETHVDRSIDSPGSFIQTDVAGVWTLLESARKHKLERFLHVSTDEVYGSIESGSFTEESPLTPSSPYSASKAGGEMMAFAYHRTYDVPVLITRGSNNYGPFQYPEKLIPLLITNLIDDQPIPIYGDGSQVRDWIYVEDHCIGIDLVLHHGQTGEAYNLGGGNERKNIDVAGLLLSYLGKPDTLIRHVVDRPGHDRRYAIDCARARAIGYAPSGSFEDRLRATVDWYVANAEWWRAIKQKQAAYNEFMTRWYAERK